MTQRERIKEYLEQNGSITDRQAYHLGIRRLSARIWELRQSPYFMPIGTEYKTVKTKNGKAVIGVYYLAHEEEEAS